MHLLLKRGRLYSVRHLIRPAQVYTFISDIGLFLLIGNTMALVFPLFTQQLFATLTYKWALTLFGVLALLMAPTPFVRPSPSFLPLPPCSFIPLLL